MSEPLRVLTVGTGAWGTTLATLVHRAGHRSVLAGRNDATVRALSEERRHPHSVPGLVLATGIEVTSDIAGAVGDAPDVVIVAVPTGGQGDVIAMLHGFGGIVVSATKGIDQETLLTTSGRFRAAGLPVDRFVALSGPNLAVEIAAGLPAAAVVASVDPSAAVAARTALMSVRFRVYTATDVIGVELAGALKNPIAIGAGIGDALDAGVNARGAFITRGIAEMARLGIACGAEPLTFAGLAGIGDLIATCSSPRSRNHTVGRRLAGGESLEAILEDMKEVAEGVPTTRAALALAERHGVELPIVAQIAEVLYGGVTPANAIARLMAREATSER